LQSADPVLVLELQGYLGLLGLGGFEVPAGLPSCELCGGDDAPILRRRTRVTATIDAAFDIRCCAHCGLLFQSPRFAPEFYRAYYGQVYRRLLAQEQPAFDSHVEDQIARGEALLESLAQLLPRPGRMLDLGCGAGGMMHAFRRRGWSVAGVDPDSLAAAHARDALGLTVQTMDAEEMWLDPGAFDLILIAGSLEHVHDITRVLARCHRAGAEDSLLLLEAHGLGQAEYLGAIGHNHRRLLTANSLALAMLRHGWTPQFITDAPLSGPTRPGSTFALGRRTERLGPEPMEAAIGLGVRDTPESMAAWLDRHGIG